MYEEYKKRLNALGETRQEASDNTTKNLQHRMILDSPSRREVKVNDEEELRPCLVSDVETYHRRRFLFVPDEVVRLGDYIYHDDKIYLTTDKNTDIIYPESYSDHCNKIIDVTVGTEKVDTGKTDFQGRPIYEEVDIVEKVPVHIKTKVYSAVSNHPISLPTGAIIMMMPYEKRYEIPLNYVVEFDKVEYKVIDKVNHVLSPTEGIVEVHAQREVVSRE